MKTSTASTCPSSRNEPRTRPPPSTRTLVIPRRPSSSSKARPGQDRSRGTRRPRSRPTRAGRAGPAVHGRSRRRGPGPPRRCGPGCFPAPGGRSCPGRSGRDARGPGGPDGQPGIVGLHRADADDDGVHPPAQLVDQPARVVRRDPAAIARGDGRLAVERHRPLGGDVGQAGGEPFPVRRVELAGRVGLAADFDADAGRPQGRQPAAVRPRGNGSPTAATTRAIPAPGSRRCRGRLAVMAARLERHVERRSASRFAGPAQGDDLGVRAAEPLVMADADRPSVADDDRADHRVGLDGAPSPRGLVEGLAHPLDVVACPTPSVGSPSSPVRTASSRLRSRPSSVSTAPAVSRLRGGRDGALGRGPGRLRRRPDLLGRREDQAIGERQPPPRLVGRQRIERRLDPSGQGGDEPGQPIGGDRAELGPALGAADVEIDRLPPAGSRGAPPPASSPPRRACCWPRPSLAARSAAWRQCPAPARSTSPRRSRPACVSRGIAFFRFAPIRNSASRRACSCLACSTRAR